MLLLNFSYPITPDQQSQIEQLTGQRLAQVIDLPVQFDNNQPFLPQFKALMAQIPLTPEQWQSEPLLVNLPSLNHIAALLLAELHGRMGYFPSIVRIRPVAGSTPPRFEVAEIINLQEVRGTAREKR